MNIPPRGFGIVALCSLRVREVPGSIPGIPLAIGPWTSPGLRFNNLTPLRMCSMIVADFFFHFLVPLEDRREQSTGRRASRKEENWGFPPSTPPPPPPSFPPDPLSLASCVLPRPAPSRRQ